MIKLYAFGPLFGQPDPSPFCMKAMILLKMAGLDYEFRPCDPRIAPKGKGPYIEDDGEKIPDTTFIRLHLQKKCRIDFDAGLAPDGRAVAWAFEKLCEDNLYFVILRERWLIERNFQAGPVRFFDTVPALMRPMVIAMVRRQIRRDLWGQGMGRHSQAELMEIARRGYGALATQLGDKPFLMGDIPTAVDAIAFPTVQAALPAIFDTPLREIVSGHACLTAYVDRCVARWFPDFKASA